jgi:predicted Abi (CAAX) family protease
MNGGQVAFYSTVATVIPVLLLGYVAGIIALARGWEAEGKRAAGTLFIAAAIAGFKRWYDGPLWLILIFGTLAAIVAALAGPPVGEYFALHALLQNRSTATTGTWATIGIATTGAAVLYPPVALVLAQVPPIVKFFRPNRTDGDHRSSKSPSDASTPSTNREPRE